MTDTLVDLNGELCVRAVFCLGDRSQNVINYWPTGIRAGEFKYNYGGELPLPLRPINNGRYEVIGEHWTRPLVVRLKDDGRTQAVKQETEDIPCPKVRAGIETRFRNGRWEKWLKAKGWVPA